jgi:single-strand selective monofunctional uracil DNA glycosylase
MSASGSNITPDKLGATARAALERACDHALARVVAAIEPGMVIGVGAFASDCARRALGDGLAIHTVLHPSPASPAANRGWDRAARSQLRACGFLQPRDSAS